MRDNNENVFVVPGYNYFACTICGHDRCSVPVPVSLDLFHSLRLGDEVKIKARGNKCGRSQYVYPKRPIPPPMLHPSEVSKIVKLLAKRLGLEVAGD